MTLIGKIEVFIIFILSIVFGVVGMMVFSSHRNWKDYAKEKRALYDAQVQVNEAQKTALGKKRPNHPRGKSRKGSRGR